MINRDLILAVIPHTHRNRFLPQEEQVLLRACHARKEHREAQRRMEGRA
jgi:hypothetical protein